MLFFKSTKHKVLGAFDRFFFFISSASMQSLNSFSRLGWRKTQRKVQECSRNESCNEAKKGFKQAVQKVEA